MIFSDKDFATAIAFSGGSSMDGHFVKRKIGVITGAGPEAGMDLWKKILVENKNLLGANFRGDIDAPAVVIYSIPALGMAMDIQHHEDGLWQVLQAELQVMSTQVDMICIACNVLHYFSDRIKALNLSAEFVSIVEVARDYICANKIEIAGLLSISSVVALDRWSPYTSLKKHVKLVTPRQSTALDQLVKNIKRYGSDREEFRLAYDQVVLDLEVDCVLQACTELPLVARPLLGIEQVDVTHLLAAALVRKSHGLHMIG